MLFRFLKDLFSFGGDATREESSLLGNNKKAKKVLNVGGNSKLIPIPGFYDGWQHDLLDIDAKAKPDILCDARQLNTLKSGMYDSVYCSHNLEHYYEHEVENVLAGFLHILNDSGFVYIAVPNMTCVAETMVNKKLDIEDILYVSGVGPITVKDVMYGWGVEIKNSGNSFFAHKTGFTQKSLQKALQLAGFQSILCVAADLEIKAIAFKKALDVNTLLPVRNNPALHVGNEYLQLGYSAQAETCYRYLLDFYPEDGDINTNLGFVLNLLENYEEAEKFLIKSIEKNDDNADSWYSLGLLKEAQNHYPEAIDCYQKALKLNPQLEPAFRDLCHAHFAVGNKAEAKRVIVEGIRVNPDEADFHFYLANLYLDEGDYAAAVKTYQKAVELNPQHSQACINLGKTLEEQGDIKAAGEVWSKAVELGINVGDPLSRKLFALTFDEHACSESGDYLKEAKRFGEHVQEQITAYDHWLVPLTKRQHQPLRVGLVSGDLRRHPVGYFLENVVKHIEATRVQLLVYSTLPKEDELTQQLKPYCASWVDISYLSDEAAAKQIRDHQVDILIDLAGHTGHNRLALFGWKPAPVQVTWLGYWASTGVPTIDYVLADQVSLPVSLQDQFTESVWYLPDTRMCFSAPTETVVVSALPAQTNGYITFGSFQNMGKISDEVLALWGKVLAAIPTARLRLQNKQLNDDSVRTLLKARLEKVGIAADRVSLLGSASRQAYLEAHREVDIVLDTFPFSGGTTTCEALWMGVPTLTLMGNTMIARQGASLLTCAGLSDWVAPTAADYLAIAIHKASDVEALARLRATLRAQVQASPLFDAPRFARHLENALHDMWESNIQAGNT